MKPTLEQIKTDESVWPEGADYFKDNLFIKVLNGRPEAHVGVQGVGFKLYTSEPKEIGNIIAHGIPRPTKAFVPEVGDKCSYSLGGKSYVCEVLKVDMTGNCAVMDMETSELLWTSNVSPIKSEREKLADLISLNIEMDISSDGIAKAIISKYELTEKEQTK